MYWGGLALSTVKVECCLAGPAFQVKGGEERKVCVPVLFFADPKGTTLVRIFPKKSRSIRRVNMEFVE